MKLYYKIINEVCYIYKGKYNFRKGKYNKKLTKELINKHDKSYIDKNYIENLPIDLYIGYHKLYAFYLKPEKGEIRIDF